MKACLLVHSAGIATAQTHLTPEQTLRISNISNLKFSPGAKLLAFDVREPVKGATASTHIWVLNLNSGALRQWTTSAKSETNPDWSPDGRYLAFLSNREDNRQIYLVRADGGEAEKLTEAKSTIQSFQWSSAGKQIAFRAGEPKTEDEEKREHDKADARVVDRDDKHSRLWTVDVDSRKVHQLTQSPWRVQEFCWIPGNRGFLVKGSEHPESDQWIDKVYSVPAAGGNFSEIASPRGHFRHLKVSLDGKQFSYLGSPGDGPTAHDLFVMPLSGGQGQNLTAARSGRPIPQFDWRHDGSFVALVQRGFTHEIASIRSTGVERMFSVFRLNPSDLAMSESGAVAAVAGDATTMPEVWLASSGGALKQVSHFNEEWSKLPLRPAELVKYPSFDGTPIEAQLVKPLGYQAGAKLPLVVLVHGGPTGAWSQRFNAWAQLLATRGYLVLFPNIRGSPSYGPHFIA